MDIMLNKPEPFVIKFENYFFDLAENVKEKCISKINHNKVFIERLINTSVQDFFQNHEYFSLKLEFNGSNGKNSFRRELFPLNYLLVNNYSLNLINISSISQNKIFIPRKIFNSELVSDYFIPIYVENEEIHILGYLDYQTVKDNVLAYSQNLYEIDFKYLKNIREIFSELKEPKEFMEKQIDFVEDINIVSYFSDSLIQNGIPEDFIEDINYVSEEWYYHLLYSEDLSEKYLRLQELYYNNAQQKKNKIIDFKERKAKLLASSFIIASKYSKKSNLPNFAAASGNQKPETFIYTLIDDKENKFKKSDKKPNTILDGNTLRILEMKDFIGKNWSLFIDVTGNGLSKLGLHSPELLFSNWNEDFFEKNSEVIKNNLFIACSTNDEDKIMKNRFEVTLGDIKLPDDIKIHLLLF